MREFMMAMLAMACTQLQAGLFDDPKEERLEKAYDTWTYKLSKSLSLGWGDYCEVDMALTYISPSLINNWESSSSKYVSGRVYRLRKTIQDNNLDLYLLKISPGSRKGYKCLFKIRSQNAIQLFQTDSQNRNKGPVYWSTNLIGLKRLEQDYYGFIAFAREIDEFSFSAVRIEVEMTYEGRERKQVHQAEFAFLPAGVDPSNRNKQNEKANYESIITVLSMTLDVINLVSRIK
jgi:hypothetical protein